MSSSRSPLAVARRLGWGVADQGVSSISNFLLGLVLARTLDAASFGAFGLAYVTYGLALSATRGIATDPLLVRFSGPQTPAWRRAVAGSSATAALAGVAMGVVCVVLGLALPDRVGGGFVALGVGLPGLMLQDSWRFAFFSVGRPRAALVNDVVWTVLQFGVLAALVLTDHVTEVTGFLAFGGTATLAAGFGLLQSRILPRPTWVRSWLVDHRALGGRYLIENVSSAGARQVRMTVLGAVAGLAAIGQVRAAEILMGPFLVILMGVSQLAVPEASHVLRRAPQHLGRFCLAIGVAAASTAAVWGVTILLLLPTGLGEGVLGPIWRPASALLPVVMVGMCAGGLEIGAAAGVRALGAAPRSLVAQLTTAALYLTGGCLGAYVDGARGSCWGVAVATSVAALVWWYELRRALAEHLAPRRDHPAAPAGEQAPQPPRQPGTISGQPEGIPS